MCGTQVIFSVAEWVRACKDGFKQSFMCRRPFFKGLKRRGQRLDFIEIVWKKTWETYVKVTRTYLANRDLKGLTIKSGNSLPTRL